MKPRGWGPKKITKKSAAACLTRLLWDCRVERLARLTLDSREWRSIKASHDVPDDKADLLLVAAQESRLGASAQAQRLLDGARSGRT